MTAIPLAVENTISGKRYKVSVMAGKDGVVTARQFLKHFSRQLGLEAETMKLQAVDRETGEIRSLEERDRLPSADHGTVEVVPVEPEMIIQEEGDEATVNEEEVHGNTNTAPRGGSGSIALTDVLQPPSSAPAATSRNGDSSSATARGGGSGPPTPLRHPAVQQHHHQQQQLEQRMEALREQRAIAQKLESKEKEQQLMKHSILAQKSPAPEYGQAARASIDPYHPDPLARTSGENASGQQQPHYPSSSSFNSSSVGRRGADQDRSVMENHHAYHQQQNDVSTGSYQLHPNARVENDDNGDFLSEEQVRRELISKCDLLMQNKERLGEELELLSEQIEEEDERRQQEAAERHQKRQKQKEDFETKDKELTHQIDVVEALIQEDSLKWRKEEQLLKQETDDLEASLLRMLNRDVNLRSQQLERLSAEVEDESSTTLNHQGRLRESREIVQHRKEEVSFASKSLNAARDRLLSSLGEVGRLNDRDKEAAQYVATTSAQLHMLKAELQGIQGTVDKLRMQKDSLVRQRRWLHSNIEEAKGHIRVVVRLRPLLPSDATTPHHATGHEEDASLIADTVQNTVKAISPTVGMREYEFFGVYGPNQDLLLQDSSSPPQPRVSDLTPEVVKNQAEHSNEQQTKIFDEQVAPMLQSLIDGVNVCVMAYGQTGSGKTFTILGERQLAAGGAPSSHQPHLGSSQYHSRNASDPAAPLADSSGKYRLTGLFPQCLRYLFHSEGVARGGTTLSLSMTELYLDDVYDLLSVAATGSTKKCEVRMLPPNSSSSSVQQSAGLGPGFAPSNLAAASKVSAGGASIVGALEIALESEEHAVSLLKDGLRLRQTHKTLRNASSSRSHLMLTVSLKDGNTGEALSKLVFLDLAGSERVSRSLSSGDRLKEAQHINKSLSALGDVMAALSSASYNTNNNNKKSSAGRGSGGSTYIPYRNSKLTSILQNCIGGTSKTLMITCICPHIPHQHNLAESLSTLSFASRTKLVRNVVQKRRAAAAAAGTSATGGPGRTSGGMNFNSSTNDSHQVVVEEEAFDYRHQQDDDDDDQVDPYEGIVENEAGQGERNTFTGVVAGRGGGGEADDDPSLAAEVAAQLAQQHRSVSQPEHTPAATPSEPQGLGGSADSFSHAQRSGRVGGGNSGGGGGSSLNRVGPQRTTLPSTGGGRASKRTPSAASVSSVASRRSVSNTSGQHPSQHSSRTPSARIVL